MYKLKIHAEYSYQILDDKSEILESNSGFDTIQECIELGMEILNQYEKDNEENHYAK